ncbi:hypothetical protein [Paraburkholderia nodosa]|uniref:hypothetical protein n=1 Tax=Paraburkholderia nodosa TaxID=392320 RepID=UPI000483250A|nr:hypothetical protein [Paraburkholderia nodosa]
MYFKTIYTIQQLRLQSSIPIEHFVNEDAVVRVVLRRPSEEELKQGFKDDVTMCEAYAELTPNKATLAVFDDIENGKLRGTPESYRVAYKDLRGEMVYLPKALPRNFEDFIKRASKLLSRAVHRVAHLVRWRTDAYGPHSPLASREMYWSRDGELWNFAPRGVSIHLEHIKTDRSFGQAEKADIDQLIESDWAAPLHHEMFREAWQQRLANPRSSMVIGVASLEIGVKHCIGRLVPDARWLAEKAPSPPIVAIIKEMFPSLPAKCALPKGATLLPAFVEDKLRSAVKIRNDLAHAGKFTVTTDSIEEILVCIKDMLWLIDFLCGYEWAYNHIREETRAAIEGNAAQPRD